MNKQKVINTVVDLYEKAEHNIKNADKPTLWIVIGLLTLALLFKGGSQEPNIIINVPKSETITPKQISASIISPSTNVQVAKQVVELPSSKAKIASLIAESTDEADSGFKYCLVREKENLNPFEPDEGDTVVFVIDEAVNKNGDVYLKSAYFSDYTEDLINTHSRNWYRHFKKVDCTSDMIAKNTREAYRNR